MTVEGSIFFVAGIKHNLHEIYFSVCCSQQRTINVSPVWIHGLGYNYAKRRCPSRSIDLDFNGDFCCMTQPRVREDNPASQKKCRGIVSSVTGKCSYDQFFVEQRMSASPRWEARNPLLRQGKSTSKNWHWRERMGWTGFFKSYWII